MDAALSARSSQTQSERPGDYGPPIAIRKDLRPSNPNPSTQSVNENVANRTSAGDGKEPRAGFPRI